MGSYRRAWSHHTFSFAFCMLYSQFLSSRIGIALHFGGVSGLGIVSGSLRKGLEFSFHIAAKVVWLAEHFTILEKR